MRDRGPWALPSRAALALVLAAVAAVPASGDEAVVRMDWEFVVLGDGCVRVVQVGNVTPARPGDVVSDVLFPVPWEVEDDSLAAYDLEAAAALPVLLEPLPSGNVAIISLDPPLVFGEHRIVWAEYSVVEPTSKRGDEWSFTATVPVAGGATVLLRLPQGAALGRVSGDVQPSRIADANGSLSVRWDDVPGERFSAEVAYTARAKEPPIIPTQAPAASPAASPAARLSGAPASSPAATPGASASEVRWARPPEGLALAAAAALLLVLLMLLALRARRPGGAMERVYPVLDERERLIVDALARRGGAMSQAAVARGTGLSTSTVSNIVRRLETRGLVERTREGKHVQVRISSAYRR